MNTELRDRRGWSSRLGVTTALIVFVGLMACVAFGNASLKPPGPPGVVMRTGKVVDFRLRSGDIWRCVNFAAYIKCFQGADILPEVILSNGPRMTVTSLKAPRITPGKSGAYFPSYTFSP